MSNIRLVCDSTAAFTRDEITQLGLEIVPLSIHFDGEVFDEGLPDTYEAFYSRLASSPVLPSTSQPSTARFLEVFEQALADGKEVVAIVLSGELSGTYSSAAMAAEQIGSHKITVIDSNTAAYNLKHLVHSAWVAANLGYTREQIKAMVVAQSPTMGAILTVGDLIYLKRGGRLKNSQYFVGKLLNILPLILLKEGKLHPHSRVKGQKALFAAMQQTAPDSAKGIFVMHINNPDGAQQLRDLMQERFPALEIKIGPISPVLGSHLGPGALGYCYFW